MPRSPGSPELSPTRHSRKKVDLFWPRRVVHETAVHRADAELALGVEPRIDPAVAVDGVGELLENLPRSRPLRGSGEQLRLAATDQPAQWTIIRDPANFTWTHGGPQPPPNGRPRSPSTPRPPSSTSSCGDAGRPPTPAAP
jgi:uncharacterized protein (TIGR03083 family)